MTSEQYSHVACAKVESVLSFVTNFFEEVNSLRKISGWENYLCLALYQLILHICGGLLDHFIIPYY